MNVPESTDSSKEEVESMVVRVSTSKALKKSVYVAAAASSSEITSEE